jgi:hypothetical protein
MSDLIAVRTGSCACGAVRFETRGEPDRAGLCHCMTCRKAHAAAFNPFLVFAGAQVSTPGYDRGFCPKCGARVLAIFGDEVEISLGSFDEPGLSAPQYECWTARREPWLPDLGLPRFAGDRQA